MRGRSFVTVLALLACKGGESDQATRPLPAAEPPASGVTRESEPAAPTAPTPAKPKERATRSADEDEPAAARATASAPAAATSAAAPAQPSCQQACQSGLQTCISQQPPDPDGGTSLEGLAKCKTALEECKARCSP